KGAQTLAEMTAKLVKDFGEAIRPYVPEIFDRARQLNEETGTLSKKVPSSESIIDDIDPDEPLDSRLIYRLAKAKLNEGVDGFENVMRAVHTDLLEVFPDLTLREVHDAFSNYGKVRHPSRDEDVKKLQ